MAIGCGLAGGVLLIIQAALLADIARAVIFGGAGLAALGARLGVFALLAWWSGALAGRRPWSRWGWPCFRFSCRHRPIPARA